MSTPVAPTALRRALLAGAAAATAALGLSALVAPNAHAAFTLGACQGSSSVRGQGSSFQTDLQAGFKQLFEGSNGCGGAPTAPSYANNGSGNGNAAMGAGGGNATLICVTLAQCTNPLPAGQRDPNSAFSGTDEAPTPTQQAAINAGTASAADDGIVHVVPIATGASAFIMRAPRGCDLTSVTNLTNGRTGTVGTVDTGDRSGNLTQRIRLTSALVEAAFASDASADTWGEIAPGIRGAPSDTQETGIADCRDVPVKRIVRQDVSGTTFAWKSYLNLIGTGRGWTTTYATPNNLTWPAAGGSGTATPTQTSTFCPNSDANRLCSNTASGGGQLANLVNGTDGSIGYVDLATARLKGFDISPSATPGDVTTQDYTFWSPLQNRPDAAGTDYAEPTSNALAHSGGVGTKGANCQNVALTGIPTPAASPGSDPTRGDWSRVVAAGGDNYPACVLTYILAWDDNAPVYGVTAAEEGKARTVKDYLSLIVSNLGQVTLASTDYSALPNPGATPLLTWAQNAVAAIDWNKTAGGGGGGGTGGGGGGTGGGGGGGGARTPAPPSNQFSIPSSSVRGAAVSFAVELPGAGALKVVATAKAGRRTIQVASVTANPTGSGKVRVKLTLSAAAKRALANARNHKLGITVKFTYTPTGGTAKTVTKTVTVRAAARRARRGGRR